MKEAGITETATPRETTKAAAASPSQTKLQGKGTQEEIQAIYVELAAIRAELKLLATSVQACAALAQGQGKAELLNDDDQNDVPWQPRAVMGRRVVFSLAPACKGEPEPIILLARPRRKPRQQEGEPQHAEDELNNQEEVEHP